VDVAKLTAHNSSMRFNRPVLVRCLQVLAVYAVVFALVVLFWALSDSNRWAGGFRPLHVRFMIALWQASGPFAFATIYPPNPFVTHTLAFLVVWSSWLAIVFTSRLRNWPLFWHFVLASLWCASGFPPASLVVT
jgi:hypothetical protein